MLTVVTQDKILGVLGHHFGSWKSC